MTVDWEDQTNIQTNGGELCNAIPEAWIPVDCSLCP